MSEPTTEAEQAEVDRDQVIRAAYTAAGARLRTAHHDEFIEYQIEECKARGLDWKPRETPEQRASSEFDRLIAEFPFLRDRLPLDTAPDAAESA
jgi:hypothetical protein